MSESSDDLGDRIAEKCTELNLPGNKANPLIYHICFTFK